MKTKFFLLGLCALALAACSVDEVSQVNDTNAIQFKATTATRATAATTNTIDGFTVWAWEKVDGTPEFMNGVQAVRASEGSSTYTTAHTYYWPGAALDFYAFIPAATEVDTEGTTDYNAYFGEYVDLSSDVIEGSTGTYSYNGYVANATITSPDAISFDMHVPADAAKGIDLGYAATLGQTAGTVGLNFRHALSQVAFKAMNGNADWTVDIKGVTLCGIYKEGTYTLPTFGENGTTAHNATDAEKGTWTIEEGAVQGRFDAGIAETVLEGTSSASQSITATDGALMLIPQTVAAWDPDTDPTNTEVGAYIRINCQVTDETGEQIWPNYHELDGNSDRLEYADITVPFEVDWAEGNLYTYTIVFGEGLGYYAPDDENTDLDGTPVLIPIRFTVDIDDFGNTDDVDVSTDTGGDEGDEGEPEPDSLVLEYTTTEESTSIALPILSPTNVTVDWGDGSEVEEVSSDNPTHTYSAAGTYTVTIDGSVGELCSYVNSSTIAGADCLTAVKYWGNMAYTSFENAFRNCTNLTSVPKSPIPFSDNVTSLRYAFCGCSSLTEVPVNMFENAKGAEQFSYLFQNCYELVNAPTFDGFSNATDFTDSFQYCYALVTLPENMFRGCASVKQFSYMFQYCEALTTVPEGIFDGCTEAQDFGSVFSRCTALETVPHNIFDDSTQAYSFNNTFRYCGSVTVESPYTEIEVDGVIVKVHLYERENYPDYFKPLASMTHNYTFDGSSFTDIDTIPSSWGGNGN